MSDPHDAPVAMTDLAERLLAPDGPAEAARLSDRFAALALANAETLDAGTPPAEAERRIALGRALDEAEIIMRDVARRTDAPSSYRPQGA